MGPPHAAAAPADFKAARCRDGGPQASPSSSAMQPEAWLCPEIQLRLRPQLWASWQTGFASEGLAYPPYWALAWPGGQALARYILDHPEIVAGRNVADWGAGCGLVTVAAAIAGARQVRAIDRDRLAIAAIEENVRINGVAQSVVTLQADLPSASPSDREVILAADLWYDRFDAAVVTAGLRSMALCGSTVLIGGSARAFAPRSGLTILSRYLVLSDPEIEQTNRTKAYVARLRSATASTRR